MKRVIHHYKVEAFPGLTVEKVPMGTRIVSVALRSIRPHVYVEKPSQPRDDRTCDLSAFFVGTGHDFDCPDNYLFLGTIADGPFMWHVYGRIV